MNTNHKEQLRHQSWFPLSGFAFVRICSRVFAANLRLLRFRSAVLDRLSVVDDSGLHAETLVARVLQCLPDMYIAAFEMQEIIRTRVGWEPVLSVHLLAIRDELGA